MRKPLLTRKDMIFNGFAVSDYMVIEKIERGSVVDVASFLKSIPGRNGALLLGSKRNAKQITVKGRMFTFGKEWHEIQKTASLIASKLRTSEPKELILRDSILIDMAILDGTMGIEKKNGTAEVTMTFLNLSGLSFGESHSIQPQSGSEFTIFNVGTEDADLRITGRTAATTAEIKNLGTGERMRFGGLAINELVTINSEGKECTGLTAKKGMNLDSEWIKVRPGENRLKITGLTATLEWRDTWM